MGKSSKQNKKKDKIKSVQQSKFNSISNSVDVENQNQGHNSKEEALGPNTKR